MRIFVFGRMGAGKDEFAAYCEEKYGAFSYALADEIRGDIIRNKPDYRPKSNRALEIEVGEMHRKWYGAEYWCRRLDDAIKMRYMPPSSSLVIIRDGRFATEYDYFVKQRGYVAVEITSSAINRMQRITKRDGGYRRDLFESKADCEIENWPAHRIKNDGTLGEFYAQIDALMRELRGEAIA